MKVISAASNWLLILILALVPMFPNAAKSQGKKPPQGTTPGPPVTKTKIEAEEFGGEFQNWVKLLTITTPDKVTFRYSTNETGAVSAIWQVSDKPFSAGSAINSGQAFHVIASGALGKVPAPGHVSQFEINFKQFVPSVPPVKPLSYWVFIVTKDAPGNPVGIASAPVKVVYKKSTQPALDLSGIPADKPMPMPIEINLTSFTVHNTNEGEGDDDPYLFIVAIYADGTTIRVTDLSHASVRIDSPSQTHNNLGMDAFSDEPKSGKTYSIPFALGHFSKGILPLSGGLPLAQARTLATVSILVITMDEDSTSDAAVNAARKALVDNLQKELNAAIRGLPAQPNVTAIQQRITAKMIDAAKKETLKDWWAPWGLFDGTNPDDFIGSGFATFSYAQLLNAGNSSLPIALNCQSSEGWYTINGSISRVPSK